MSLSRFEELKRARRLLELAEVQALNGEHFEAETTTFKARDIIFRNKQQAEPARPAVAGTSNTGSCSVSLPA